MYRIQAKIYTQKSFKKKKLLFSNLKSTHSQLSLEKIDVVAILDHFAAYFETKLILVSRRLANWEDTD